MNELKFLTQEVKILVDDFVYNLQKKIGILVHILALDSWWFLQKITQLSVELGVKH